MATIVKTGIFSNLTDFDAILKANATLKPRYIRLGTDAGTGDTTYHFSSVIAGDETELDVEIAAYADDPYEGPNGMPRTTQTTDNTFNKIAIVPIPVGSVIMVRAFILARTTDGAQRAAFEIWACFYNEGSGVVRQGAVQNNGTRESNTNWDVTLAASGETCRVRVKGDTSETVDWKARVRTMELMS